MKNIGIIGAMPQEVEIIKNNIKNLKETKIGGCKFFTGTILNHKVTLTQSGIGKVAATIGTTILIENFKPDVIINTGSAGSLKDHFNIGDVVVSTNVTHHDVDLTAFGYAMGQCAQLPINYSADKHLIGQLKSVLEQENLNYHFGLLCSGDSFVASEHATLKIKKDFPEAIAVDMEASAIAQTCFMFDVPFVVLRAISDGANNDSSMTFEEFLPIASKNSSKIILILLENL